MTWPSNRLSAKYSQQRPILGSLEFHDTDRCLSIRLKKLSW
jgi:hypothetical protein